MRCGTTARTKQTALLLQQTARTPVRERIQTRSQTLAARRIQAAREISSLGDLVVSEDPSSSEEQPAPLRDSSSCLLQWPVIGYDCVGFWQTVRTYLSATGGNAIVFANKTVIGECVEEAHTQQSVFSVRKPSHTVNRLAPARFSKPACHHRHRRQ